MASAESVKILEQFQVVPQANSLESATEFSLPLPFLDLFWFKFPPVERLYFYQLNVATPFSFNSVILPKLKHSLSVTLLHYLPVAGRLIWPSQSPKPIFLYTPNDGVSVTVAYSNADFDQLSSNEIIDSLESRPYVPQLTISHSEASVLALQITLFPNKGFVIGYAVHHAFLDGKSSNMFMKSWAYLCKETKGEDYPSSLPEELTPFLDRTIIKDPLGLDMLYLKTWATVTEPESLKNPRSLNLLPSIGITNTVRSTFQLTRENINNLRKKVSSQVNKNSLHLSTFVLTYSYVMVCMVRARGGDKDRKVYFIFSVDCRNRLDPPLPKNYFGNCIEGQDMTIAAREFMQENSIPIIAEKISGLIKELENKRFFEGGEQKLLLLKELGVMQGIGVSGSPRFNVYGTDFGWEKPKKVEFISIDKTGAIALAESGDGSGGVEIGLVLTRYEMEVFASLFASGLQDL